MADTPAIDSNQFRDVLGTFATGVTVITGMDGDDPVGLAVSAFSSLSLEPPLVLWCADKGSSSWPRIQASGAFAVNILGADQQDVCGVFAGKSADKFAEVPWQPTATGSPRIDGVLSWIDCEIHDVLDQGDHWIVVGRVVDAGVDGEAGPLVYYRGGFGKIAD